jgi:hypothetical protein
MISIPPPKDIGWQAALKSKNQQFVLYKKCISLTKNRHWIGWEDEKYFQANGPWKQAGVVIFTSDKVDFKSKLVRRDKEGHSILIKQIINKEEIITVTLCEPNTMITGEFITLL